MVRFSLSHLYATSFWDMGDSTFMILLGSLYKNNILTNSCIAKYAYVSHAHQNHEISLARISKTHNINEPVVWFILPGNLYAQKVQCSCVIWFLSYRMLFLYKLPWGISAKDSTRMIGRDNSQYCFWLVQSLSVNKSCEWSLLRNFHMITYIKNCML